MANHLVAYTVPFSQRFGVPVVASIPADTAEDFGALAARVSVPGAAAIKAIISCPNPRAHGAAFGMDTVATAAVQMGTDNVIHPHAMPEAIVRTEDYCRRHGSAAVRDLTGALADTHTSPPKLPITI